MEKTNSALYVGNKRQINDVRFVSFLEGKASGMKAYEVQTASGFFATIELDRGMDIANLKVNGKNISFMSSTGLVNSTYFTEDHDRGFMRNFNVGFLTTGGLSYIGSSEDNKGLHGVISNTPAENFSYHYGPNYILIEGYIKESEMFGPNLELKRKIYLYTDKKNICLKDRLVNLSDVTQQYMVLYHNNYGYPFFDPQTTLSFNPDATFSRDGRKQDKIDSFNFPEDGKAEKVVFNIMKSPEYILQSPHTGLKVKVEYSQNTLPVLNQWILERSQNYVLGLEPGTNNVNGYSDALAKGNLKKLKPKESVNFELNYKFKEINNETIKNKSNTKARY